MHRRSGKSYPSVGLAGDVTSFECGLSVLPKRGLKRSPIARKYRQRKFSRRHGGTLARRSTLALSRDGSKGAAFSTGQGQEGTDGSDCDEALKDCIPVQPEEVFDLVDEQTASETEERKDSDSDATIDSEGRASGLKKVPCELPGSCLAEVAPASGCRIAKRRTTPSITKQVIQPADVADEATVQSTVVNRPIPMPPIIKPPPVAQSITQEALLVYAPVDLTQLPIGHLPVQAQDTSLNYQIMHDGPQGATPDCIPPPCDLPDCDDWPGIDSSPLIPSSQPPKTGSIWPVQGYKSCHVFKTSETCPASSFSPPGLIAADETVPQGDAGPQHAMPVQPSTLSPLRLLSNTPVVAPEVLATRPVTRPPPSLSLAEPRASISGTSPVSAQASVRCEIIKHLETVLDEATCVSPVPGQPRFIHEHVGSRNGAVVEASDPDICHASTAKSEGTTQMGCFVVQPGATTAPCPVPLASEGDAAGGDPQAVGAQPNSELADSGSPTVWACVDCGGSQSTSYQANPNVLEQHEPMHWLFSPLKQCDMQGLQMSPVASLSQAGLAAVSGSNHGQASCSCAKPYAARCEPQAPAQATADGDSARALGSTCRHPAGQFHIVQPAAPCCSNASGANGGTRASDYPTPSLELEDDDLYRIFAMTCTTSPGAEKSAVPASFMDLLLNEEDENDLDWLAAEASEADVLSESPLHMSPDGPHAHTRLRILGHGQLPTQLPAQHPLEALVNSYSSAGFGKSRVTVDSHVAEVTEASGPSCNESLHSAWPSHGVHDGGGESTAVADTLQLYQFSHSQLRQLYAQVQAHAQLLLQSFLLASQGQVSVTVTRDVEKLWAWSDSLLKCGPLREEQDGVASDTWEMLTDLIYLDRELSDAGPEKQIPARLLGAITPADFQHDPKRMVMALEDGWRPVLVQPAVPSIVHVPWLTHLDALVQACGICIKMSPEGRSVLTQVSCDSFSQVSTDASCASKAGTFMQPLSDDPDAAPGCRRNMRAFRSSPYTVHIQNVMAQYAVWWNRGLFPRIDGSRSSCLGSRRKAATLVDELTLATLVLHHGRDYMAIADAVPGWTEDWVRIRLRNNGRKDLINETRTEGASSIDMRTCIKDIIQKTLESVDGELTPEENIILAPLVRNQDCLAHDFWDHVTMKHVPWRKPGLLNRMWHKACKQGCAPGKARPTKAWWAARSRCLLTGANRCLWSEDDGTPVEADLALFDLLHERNQEYEMKLLEHATILCTL